MFEALVELFSDSFRKYIFIDADDTLWHDSKYFRVLRSELKNLYPSFETNKKLNEHLSNVGLGEREFAKAVESTAIEFGVNSERLKLLNTAIRDFLSHDIELLPNVEEALKKMSNYNLILLTKGVEGEQRDKLDRSDLANYFKKIIIVEQKTPTFFSVLLDHLKINGNEVIVIGNSIRHDIIPALNGGAAAIWLNHPENQYGSNEAVPGDLCHVDGWSPILKALESISSNSH